MGRGFDDYSLDHVIVTDRTLEAMVEQFSRLRLTPDPGGIHDNGVTHNSILGFDDGTYIELLSTVQPGQIPPRRKTLIRDSAGPAGWAISPRDFDQAMETLVKRDVQVKGPLAMSRETVNGDHIEWDVTFLGDCVPGTRYPFLIADRTPRKLRVQPSDSVTGTELVGVRYVLLGVEDLEKAISDYRHMFDLSSPFRWNDAEQNIDVAVFEDSPVILTSPESQNSWLTDRTARFSELPWGFLLGTTDFSRSQKRFSLSSWNQPLQQRIGWITEIFGNGGRIGLVEVSG